MKQCGLCCEIMREDGTMMRTSELLELAHEHNLVIVVHQATCRTVPQMPRQPAWHEQATRAAALPRYGDFQAHRLS